MIILGGGLVKHHIANANLMVREGSGWDPCCGLGWWVGGCVPADWARVGPPAWPPRLLPPSGSCVLT